MLRGALRLERIRHRHVRAQRTRKAPPRLRITTGLLKPSGARRSWEQRAGFFTPTRTSRHASQYDIDQAFSEVCTSSFPFERVSMRKTSGASPPARSLGVRHRELGPPKADTTKGSAEGGHTTDMPHHSHSQAASPVNDTQESVSVHGATVGELLPLTRSTTAEEHLHGGREAADFVPVSERRGHRYLQREATPVQPATVTCSSVAGGAPSRRGDLRRPSELTQDEISATAASAHAGVAWTAAS